MAEWPWVAMNFENSQPLFPGRRRPLEKPLLWVNGVFLPCPTSYFSFSFCFVLCECMNMCVFVHVHGMCVRVRRQLVGVSFPL